jgi:hypothetical protein
MGLTSINLGGRPPERVPVVVRGVTPPYRRAASCLPACGLDRPGAPGLERELDRGRCHCACCGTGGVHLTLRNATESIDVHLGPAWFLSDEKLTLAEGDALAILGSRVTIGDTAVVVAREVTKGETTVRLRDESGRPLWRHGRT